MSKEFLLSEQEFGLVRDPEIFYAKHRIIDKLYALFGALSTGYSPLTVFLPPEVTAVPPKIYKGENYRLLPYVMLDHPRFFRPGEAFAVRSLFWWGRHFSIHLVLGGKYKEAYQEKIFQSLCAGNLSGWHFALTDDPWQHDFEQDNYTPAEQFSDGRLPVKYLKLGAFLPLDKWDEADQFFITSFARIMSVLKGLAA